MSYTGRRRRSKDGLIGSSSLGGLRTNEQQTIISIANNQNSSIFSTTSDITNATSYNTNNNSAIVTDNINGESIKMNDGSSVYYIYDNILQQAPHPKQRNNDRQRHNRHNHHKHNQNTKQSTYISIISMLIILFINHYISNNDNNYQMSPIDILSDILLAPFTSHHQNVEYDLTSNRELLRTNNNPNDIIDESQRPKFVYEHPYVSSSYYTSTTNFDTLRLNEEYQVIRNLRREAEEQRANYNSHNNGGEGQHKTKTRVAIVRPFCEFDAEALPTTFTCWDALPPCKAASDANDYDSEEKGGFEVNNYGELVSYNNNSTAGQSLYNQATQGEGEEDRHAFDQVGSNAMKHAAADIFLFYSQTFSENAVATTAVDTIINSFFTPGGWSQCFDNIYAIEANIPQELDLYIPSAQEELYNWVNGPNRQFEAAFRIIQSGEWGEYDGFYLMEGDSVPIKAHWLDVIISEIEVNRPFAILGA